MKTKIGIAIPCYNVEKSISLVLDGFSEKTLSEVDTIFTIDNCSKDSTLKVLRDYQQSDRPAAKRLSVIKNTENYGLGGSQKVAYRHFLENGFTHLMLIHGDNQCDGEALAQAFLNELHKDPSIDLVLTSRFDTKSDLSKYDRSRVLGNLFFNFLTYALTGNKIADAGAGVYFMNTRVLQKVDFRPLTNSFQFNPQMNILLHEDKTLKTKLLPINWRDSEDASNIRSIPYSIELTKILARYGFAKYFLRRGGPQAFYRPGNELLQHFTVMPKTLASLSNAPLKTPAFGGNQVRTLKSQPDSVEVFCREDAYEYSMVSLKAGEKRSFEHLRSLTVYAFNGSIKLLPTDKTLSAGEVGQAEDQAISIECLNGPARILVAGITKTVAGRAVKVLKESEVKKVEKPWGYELWLNGEHPGYAFKKIFIKAGTKTSLQYHQEKRETNVLFDGSVYLHYKSNPAVSNDQVTASDVSTHTLKPVSIIDVQPKTLHRLEAISDILLFEVSTPHLNDVVRVSDDTNRAGGRIEAEHSRAHG